MAIQPTSALIQAIARNAQHAAARPAAAVVKPTQPVGTPSKPETTAAVKAKFNVPPTDSAPQKIGLSPAEPRRDLPRGSIIDILA